MHLTCIDQRPKPIARDESEQAAKNMGRKCIPKTKSSWKHTSQQLTERRGTIPGRDDAERPTQVVFYRACDSSSDSNVGRRVFVGAYRLAVHTSAATREPNSAAPTPNGRIPCQINSWFRHQLTNHKPSSLLPTNLSSFEAREGLGALLFNHSQATNRNTSGLKLYSVVRCV